MFDFDCQEFDDRTSDILHRVKFRHLKLFSSLRHYLSDFCVLVEVMWVDVSFRFEKSHQAGLNFSDSGGFDVNFTVGFWWVLIKITLKKILVLSIVLLETRNIKENLMLSNMLAIMLAIMLLIMINFYILYNKCLTYLCIRINLYICMHICLTYICIRINLYICMHIYCVQRDL
jgi:hypothetical protein